MKTKNSKIGVQINNEFTQKINFADEFLISESYVGLQVKAHIVRFSMKITTTKTKGTDSIRALIIITNKPISDVSKSK